VTLSATGAAGYTAREMAEQHVSRHVVARGELRRMRELAGRFAAAGIASELVRPDPRERHG
jgi:hypothetical protein